MTSHIPISNTETEIESTTDIVSIPVILGKLPRNGERIAVGIIRAGDFIPRAYISHRDSANDQGYQRLPNRSRVQTLANDLIENKVDLPTALLLNLREFDDGEQISQLSNGTAILNLKSESLFVVDAQHREEALRVALQNHFERFKDYTIPFVLGLGWTRESEMEKFYVVNSNAKSVSTTLAFDILSSLNQQVPGLMDDLEARGQIWKVNGQEIARELAENSDIWRDRIRFSNEPMGGTTVPSAGFVISLKPILASAYFARLTRGAQARVLSSYWEGIQMVLPGIFEDPQAYVLQKSLGVQVMHSIFNQVIEVVRSNGDDVTQGNSYSKVIRSALEILSGDTRAGEQVDGEEFWLSGEHGAAGGYSSSAGQRVLSAILKRNLPQIEV